MLNRRQPPGHDLTFAIAYCILRTDARLLFPCAVRVHGDTSNQEALFSLPSDDRLDFFIAKLLDRSENRVTRAVLLITKHLSSWAEPDLRPTSTAQGLASVTTSSKLRGSVSSDVAIICELEITRCTDVPVIVGGEIEAPVVFFARHNYTRDLLFPRA